MKPLNLMTASATALTIALGGPISAQQMNGALPPGQMTQLMQALQTLCAADAPQPDALDCDLVQTAQGDPAMQREVLTMLEDLNEAGVTLDGVDAERLLEMANRTEAGAAPDAEAAAAAETEGEEIETAETEAAETDTSDEIVGDVPAETAVNGSDVATDDDDATPAEAEATAETETTPETTTEAEAPAATEVEEPVTGATESAETPTGDAEGDDLAAALEADAQAEADTETAATTEPPVGDTDVAAQDTAPAADAETGGAAAEAEADVAAETDATPEEDQTASADAETAGDAGAPETAADAETPVAEVEELDPQAQADAAAAADTAGVAAAAAAGADATGAEPEAVQETVTQETVRQSSEDFATDVTQAPADASEQETEEARTDEDDDDGGLDPIIQGGIAAFGAAVLADILSGDDQVVSNTGDRVVVENDGQYRVLRNDDVLLRRPGADITTYEYDDGSTRNVVRYDDGTVVETVRAANGRVLRRTRTLQDGTEVVLFDDTQQTEEVVVNDLPQTSDQRSGSARMVYDDRTDQAALERALAAQNASQVNRRFSLNQVRNIDAVRELVPQVSVNTINFQTDSAAIRAEEAEELRALGTAMRDIIERNPGEVFLIEGHTDAVGDYAYNLALSDRRAESVALALTEYFDVPPENMVLQGYGESDLLVETSGSERANRRAAVRRITPLLQGG
ncbi:OmpA family protein [Marivita sp.]|uniref:OmpA family protein n=1 Tax=Marivita sp. TaxID=2003365 RepID=UPI0025C5FB1F|nr:OmpA family protein [Marivita sp.]